MVVKGGPKSQCCMACPRSVSPARRLLKISSEPLNPVWKFIRTFPEIESAVQ